MTMYAVKAADTHMGIVSAGNDMIYYAMILYFYTYIIHKHTYRGTENGKQRSV